MLFFFLVRAGGKERGSSRKKMAAAATDEKKSNSHQTRPTLPDLFCDVTLHTFTNVGGAVVSSAQTDSKTPPTASGSGGSAPSAQWLAIDNLSVQYHMCGAIAIWVSSGSHLTLIVPPTPGSHAPARVSTLKPHIFGAPAVAIDSVILNPYWNSLAIRYRTTTAGSVAFQILSWDERPAGSGSSGGGGGGGEEEIVWKLEKSASPVGDDDTQSNRVDYWKWLDRDTLAIVGNDAVLHWDLRTNGKYRYNPLLPPPEH